MKSWMPPRTHGRNSVDKSLHKAAVDVSVLLNMCEAGEFYEDYDLSVSVLARATESFNLILQELIDD